MLVPWNLVHFQYFAPPSFARSPVTQGHFMVPQGGWSTSHVGKEEEELGSLFTGPPHVQESLGNVTLQLSNYRRFCL